MTDSDTLAAVERWFRSRRDPHVMVWAMVNLARRRPALARPNRVGPTDLAIFVLLVPVLDLLAGGAHLLVDGTLRGRSVAVTSELLQAAGFLTAFSGFCFTVHVLTDATYRKEFLDEVLVELRQAFAVRAVYLASRRA